MNTHVRMRLCFDDLTTLTVIRQIAEINSSPNLPATCIYGILLASGCTVLITIQTQEPSISNSSHCNINRHY